MTVERATQKLKDTATLGQIIYAVLSVIVMIIIFALTMRSDVNASIIKNIEQDKKIELLEERLLKQADKNEANQKEIMEKLNSIELQVNNKQDRKN